MNTDYETKLIYNGISFQRSNRLSIEEREIHSYHEILFCMDANAVLLTEKQQIKIQGDALLLIPKRAYHFFRLQDCEKFSRLKIYFSADILDATPCGDIMSGIRIVEKPEGQILRLLKKLCQTMEDPNAEKQGFYAYSAFLMLLAELDRSGLGSEPVQKQERIGELDQIIRYISENLSGKLTAETLSKQMCLSLSGFTHMFKKEMGIPVHRYVKQRRLIFAQTLLRSAEKPTKIYMDCGFKDYSSFYKAYVLFFGYPPSAEEKE